MPKYKKPSNNRGHFKTLHKKSSKIASSDQSFIDFQKVNNDLKTGGTYESLLYRLLPGGKLQGQEYLARNPKRNDATLGSFKINIYSGMWSDFAIRGASGGDIISLYAYLHDLSQKDAALELVEIWNA